MRAGASVSAASDGATSASILLDALDAAIGGIQSLGKSAPGEKTMLDALVPGVAAGRSVSGDGAEIGAVTGAIADAAEAGAEATIPMLATKGRASYLGERSIGHQDPGATSAALLLRALADAVAEQDAGGRA
jgi:dihydroxyacetone kinase-like protein